MTKPTASTPRSGEPILGMAKMDNVRKVAKWQRLLMASIVVYIALGLLVRFGLAPSEYVVFARVGVSFFHLWCIISICQFLSMERESWIYFIGVFVPYINFVVLLVLNWKATKFIQSAGFQVGIFGANVP